MSKKNPPAAEGRSATGGHPASQSSHAARNYRQFSAPVAPGASLVDTFAACAATYEWLAACGLLSETVVDALAAAIHDAEGVEQCQ